MRNRITIVLTVTLALCGAAALAQAPAPSGASPEMKKLDFLVGKWSVSTKAGLLSGTPIELEGTGETKWALGGQYLLQRETDTSPVQPAFENLRLIGYDPQTKQYRMWRFSSGGGRPYEWSGHLEDGKLVLSLAGDPARAGSIGISYERTPEGHVRIRGVYPGGAAAKAGLKKGGLIAQINGTPLSPTTPILLGGRAGTRVRLTVRSGAEERALTLTRQAAPPLRVIMESPSNGECRITFENRVGGRWQKNGETVLTRVRVNSDTRRGQP